MQELEILKETFSKEENQLISIPLLISAVCGDKGAAFDIARTLIETPFLLKDKILWTKIEKFMRGTFLCDEDRSKFDELITMGDKKEDNALRILNYIDKAENMEKVQYIINATRALILNYVDRETFFRVCSYLTDSLMEDLYYLKENIESKDLPYSLSVQSLFSLGLMYQSKIDPEGNTLYSFTSAAVLVDEYSLSFSDEGRYPDKTKPLEIVAPKSEIKSYAVFGQ